MLIVCYVHRYVRDQLYQLLLLTSGLGLVVFSLVQLAPSNRYFTGSILLIGRIAGGAVRGHSKNTNNSIHKTLKKSRITRPMQEDDHDVEWKVLVEVKCWLI